MDNWQEFIINNGLFLMEKKNCHLHNVSQILDISGGFLPEDIACDMFTRVIMEHSSIISLFPLKWKAYVSINGHQIIIIYF